MWYGWSGGHLATQQANHAGHGLNVSSASLQQNAVSLCSNFSEIIAPLHFNFAAYLCVSSVTCSQNRAFIVNHYCFKCHFKFRYFLNISSDLFCANYYWIKQIIEETFKLYSVLWSDMANSIFQEWLSAICRSLYRWGQDTQYITRIWKDEVSIYSHLVPPLVIGSTISHLT
jgi:hypothetical protein